MSTMNISLPHGLKDFVEEQVEGGGYSTSSEYVRELIRHDKDRQQLKEMLLKGLKSGPAVPTDASFFEGLRQRIREQTRTPE